jgi:transmembrane sensor
MRGKNEREIRDAITDEAYEFILRDRDGELTSSQEKLEFLNWLCDNKHNIGGYIEAAELTRGLGRVLGARIARSGAAQAGQSALKVVDIGLRPTTHRPRDPWKRIGVASAVLLTAGMIWTGLRHEWFAKPSIRVEHGDQRALRLDDGSMAYLNSDTEVRVRYTQAERRIELLQGQALFKVAKNSHRPFRVTVGDAVVIAVGTQFDLYRQPQGTTVTVIEGKVDVLQRAQGSMFEESENNPAAVVPVTRIPVSAGEQVHLGAKPAMVRTKPADLVVATAWVRRQIVLGDRTLNEIVMEYNRYLPTPLLIDDATLRKRRVSGTFPAYEPELFLAFLREIQGVVIDEQIDAVHLRMSTAEANAPTQATAQLH